MTSNRKALFFDIDGTLLSEVNRNVPESARKAVAGARAAGHLVFINSGRTYRRIAQCNFSVTESIKVVRLICSITKSPFYIIYGHKEYIMLPEACEDVQ